MNRKLQLGFALLFCVGLIGLIVFLMQGHTVSVLQPKGEIAEKQRNLILFSVGLSLVVIVPVYMLLFHIVWKYRSSNKKAKYSPDWDSNKSLEITWWGIPIILILILSVVTWNSSHDLDPFKPLVSDKKPLKIQVVALQWQWLFIYPEENIATINYVQIPKDTPIDFEITADAPMNSFWVPELGGQIYAMSGMATHLNLKATEVGSFDGVSANISGEGFSGMKFITKATPQADYDKWVEDVKQDGTNLDQESYSTLSQPTKDAPARYFATSEPGLFNSIVMKFHTAGVGGLNHSGSEHNNSSHEKEGTR